VPTGEYEVEASVDLTPVFGKLRRTERLLIERPGPDALDKAIARLEAAAPDDRWAAVDDLRWFAGHGDRIVPLLVRIVAEREEGALFSAIYALAEYPDQAELTRPALLPLLGGKEPAGCTAAWVLGILFPKAQRLAEAYRAAHDRAEWTLVEKAATALRRLLEK
jgi:hypothetical protein